MFYVINSIEYEGVNIKESNSNEESQNKSYELTIDGLNEQTSYTFSLKIKNQNQYNQKSISSLFITQQTNCDKDLYTDEKCKGEYGPKDIIDSVTDDLTNVEQKDPNSVDKWPYFRKPAEDECSCIDFNLDDRIDYCEGYKDDNNLRFDGYKYNLVRGMCLKVKTNEDCEKETDTNSEYYDPLFKMKPDEDANIKSTECRELTLDEKKDKCDDYNMHWWISSNGIDYKCRNKILIEKVNILKIDPYECKLMIEYFLNDDEVNNEKIEYKLFDMNDNMLKENETYLDKDFIKSSDNVETSMPNYTKATFTINNLTSNTEYKIKVLIKTQFDGYISNESDFINFKTICDSSKFTFNTCKGNYGPIKIDDQFNVNNEIDNKDPSLSFWPYHKKEGECGCTSYNDEEKIKYCKQLIGDDIDESLLLEENGTCQNNIPKLGDVNNLSLMKLTYNQYLDNKNKLKDDAEFGKHKDYRVLIQWSIPDIPQKIIHRGSIEPKEYIIYRKGSNFEREIGRVDINDDNSYLFLDDLELLPNIDYQYKIISVNDAGDSNSKYSKSVRFESVLKQSDCDLLFDDVDTSLRYIGTNNVFKVFQKL